MPLALSFPPVAMVWPLQMDSDLGCAWLRQRILEAMLRTNESNAADIAAGRSTTTSVRLNAYALNGIEPPTHISGDRKIQSGDHQNHSFDSDIKSSEISVINPYHAPQNCAVWPQAASSA